MVHAADLLTSYIPRLIRYDDVTAHLNWKQIRLQAMLVLGVGFVFAPPAYLLGSWFIYAHAALMLASMTYCGVVSFRNAIYRACRTSIDNWLPRIHIPPRLSVVGAAGANLSPDKKQLYLQSLALRRLAFVDEVQVFGSLDAANSWLLRLAPDRNPEIEEFLLRAVEVGSFASKVKAS